MKAKILPLYGSILLVGCPLSQEVELSNNSGSNVELVLSKTKRKWAAASVINVADSGGDISWKELTWRGEPNTNFYPLLIIRCGDSVNSYDLSKLYSYDKMKEKKGRSILYRFQLERNCGLYMLPVDSSFGVVPSEDYLFKPIYNSTADD